MGQRTVSQKLPAGQSITKQHHTKTHTFSISVIFLINTRDFDVARTQKYLVILVPGKCVKVHSNSYEDNSYAYLSIYTVLQTIHTNTLPTQAHKIFVRSI